MKRQSIATVLYFYIERPHLVEYYIIEMNPEPNCLRSNSSVRKLFLLFCFTFVFVFKIKNYQFVSFVINSNYPSSQSQSLAITNSFFSLDALFFLFMSINSKAEILQSL